MLTSPEFKLKNMLGSRITRKYGMQGKYRFEVRREGRLRVQTDWQPNLILDQGRVRLMQSSVASGPASFYGYCHVGTGTSAPSVSQTQLDARVQAIQVQGGNIFLNSSGSPNYVRSATVSYSFAQGTVTGVISEVGVGWAATGATLFSRTLLVNGNGDPAPLTLTSMDQLTVYYSFSIVPNLAPLSGAVVLESNTYTYTVYNQGLGVSGYYFSSPSIASPWFTCAEQTYGIQMYVGGPGSVRSADIVTSSGYLSGTVSPTYGPSMVRNVSLNLTTFTMTTTLIIPPSACNVSGGIKALGLFNQVANSNFPSMYYEFDTPVPKTNTKEFVVVYESQFGN